MRPVSFLFIVWLAGLGLSSPSCLAASRDEPDLTLKIEPTTIKLARFDKHSTESVYIIAHVGDSGGLPADIAPSSTSSPGLHAHIGLRLAKAGDIVWPADISVAGDPADAGVVEFRLAPARSAKESNNGARDLAVQRASVAVTIEPARDAAPADDADVKVEPDTGDFDESKSFDPYLLIRNKSNYEFTVADIQFNRPKFLQVNYTSPVGKKFTAKSVGPHTLLIIPLNVAKTENESSQMGNWLVLANVAITRGQGGLQRASTVPAEFHVTVGVPGVSDVLKAFDLPNLLLVPGALILATWSLLFGGARSAQYRWLEWKSTGFWLVATTLSILIFGGLFLHFGNLGFLAAFGIGQVALLWLGCVGIGVVSFFSYRAAVRMWNAWTARDQPKTTDEPLDILQKLQRKSVPFYLPAFQYSSAGAAQPIFKLDFKVPDEKFGWVIPRMLYKKLLEGSEANELMEGIERANDAIANEPHGPEPAKLVAALKKGLTQKWISLEWENGTISRPSLVSIDKLGQPQQPAKQSPLDLAAA